jgi:hypothetical protein
VRDNSANYILQGGNSRGAALTIGTNDNNHLNFETAGSTKLTILSTNNVGIGTTTPNQLLTVSGNISSTGTIQGTTLIVNTLATGSTDSVVIHSSGTLQQRAIDTRVWGSTLVNGSGTTNTVPKFTGTTALGNSIITDNGTNVGINTSNPNQRLTVAGSISSTGSIFTSAGPVVASTSTLETPTTGISAVSNIVAVTQATYNALTVKLPTTVYLIVN